MKAKHAFLVILTATILLGWGISNLETPEHIKTEFRTK